MASTVKLLRYLVLAVVASCFLYALQDRILAGGEYRWTTPKLPDSVLSAHVEWNGLPVRYPLTSLTPLPAGKPLTLPKVQIEFPDESADQKVERLTRKQAVKDAFERCWYSYKSHAWMADELAPVSGGKKNHFGGWAATLVDSLDTLWIMDMMDEFETAVSAAVPIDFGASVLEEINVFETTIRYLGGFLAAYDLSGDQRLLDKAVQLGDMLLVTFDTPNRMPITRWNVKTAKSMRPQYAHETTLVAELGSLSLEFTRLSQIMGDPRWYDAIDRVMRLFDEQQSKTRIPGMWPIIVNARVPDLTFHNSFTLGAMADSLYEYLPKMYALLGGLDPKYKKMYQDSMAAAIKYTLWRPMTPDNADILLSGTAAWHKDGVLGDTQGQHLVCFAGGMFALGGRLFEAPHHVEVGRKLTDGCVWTYKAMPLGIMPEVFSMSACPTKKSCQWDEVQWKKDVVAARGGDPKYTPAVADAVISEKHLPPGFSSIKDPRYLLRPEAIESVFVLYRTSGRRDLLDAAWDMFQAVQNNTRTALANGALADVTRIDGKSTVTDSMESFWMAETLKYFYLIFSEPSVISLDEYVLNTEAHPFKRPVG